MQTNTILRTVWQDLEASIVDLMDVAEGDLARAPASGVDAIAERLGDKICDEIEAAVQTLSSEAVATDAFLQPGGNP